MSNICHGNFSLHLDFMQVRMDGEGRMLKYHVVNSHFITLSPIGPISVTINTTRHEMQLMSLQNDELWNWVLGEQFRMLWFPWWRKVHLGKWQLPLAWVSKLLQIFTSKMLCWIVFLVHYKGNILNTNWSMQITAVYHSYFLCPVSLFKGVLSSHWYKMEQWKTLFSWPLDFWNYCPVMAVQIELSASSRWQ